VKNTSHRDSSIKCSRESALVWLLGSRVELQMSPQTLALPRSGAWFAITTYAHVASYGRSTASSFSRTLVLGRIACH
jgi:hypothetical protein